MHFAISIANLMNKFALLFSGCGVPDSYRDGSCTRKKNIRMWRNW
jgi:hypothetical protein